MSRIRLQGSTSGYAELAASAIAGDVTITLPSTTGTVATTNGGQTVQFAAGSAGAPALTTTGDTNTGIFFPTADTIAFAEGGVESMRVDSSGRLLVGTSTSPSSGDSQYARLRVQGNTLNSGGFFALARNDAATSIVSGHEIGHLFFTDNAGNGFASIKCEADANAGTNDYPGRLMFSTTADGASSPTERVRVDSAGRVMFGKPYNETSKGCHILPDDSNTGRFQATGDNSGSGAAFLVSNALGNATFIVRPNGNVQNTNNSYGAISDVKLKENIVDAGSQWDDLKALQVRKYNFKEGQTHTQIGLVAQEVELVSPGLVTEAPDRDEDGNDLGTVTKSVNYSVLYMKAVKALQEAMERIETLEASNADLAARLTALEAN